MPLPCKKVKKLKIDISSSESEDDNLQNLKSAIDPTFNCNGKILDTKKIETKFISNRNVDEANKFNELNTTPEFRHFVAKKLAERLDSQIKYVDKKLVTNKVQDTKHIGVRLFSTSKKFVTIDDEEISKPKKILTLKTDLVDTSSDEEYNERLASVAVTPEWIINGQALYNVESNLSPPQDAIKFDAKDSKKTLKSTQKKTKKKKRLT